MSEWMPADEAYRNRVREDFARQRFMQWIGAVLERVEPGVVTIGLPFREELTQQDGYLHAGVVTTIADSACGYAAYSLMPPGANVLSVEFKVNLLRPAQGESFLAEATVLKAGATLTVTRCDVYARQGQQSRLVASMQATMIRR
jgi:uncharacterized protein (TIGR00369 family)